MTSQDRNDDQAIYGGDLKKCEALMELQREYRPGSLRSRKHRFTVSGKGRIRRLDYDERWAIETGKRGRLESDILAHWSQSKASV
jgi:hypothetical protein